MSKFKFLLIYFKFSMKNLFKWVPLYWSAGSCSSILDLRKYFHMCKKTVSTIGLNDGQQSACLHIPLCTCWVQPFQHFKFFAILHTSPSVKMSIKLALHEWRVASSAHQSQFLMPFNEMFDFLDYFTPPSWKWGAVEDTHQLKWHCTVHHCRLPHAL